MSHVDGHLEDPVQALCGEWRRRSLLDGWRSEQDWSDPAAVALAAALVHGADAAPCARVLGAARARTGVGIVEALRDLTHLFGAHGEPCPPMTLVLLAGGWEDAHDGMAASPWCVDPVSGLGAADHLVLRVTDAVHTHDLVRSGARLLGMVLVDGRAGALGQLSRWERDIVLGESVRRAFGPDAVSGYRDGVAVVLVGVRRPPTVVDEVPGVARLRQVLSEVAGERRAHGERDLVRLPAKMQWEPVTVADPGVLRARLGRLTGLPWSGGPSA